MPLRTDTAIWSGLFRISADSGQTLQAQIRQAILDRQIAASMPLPSCRILAGRLGVARGTVVLAFQQLVDQGFLVARERRGHFVNTEVLATPAKPHPKNPDTTSEVDWKRLGKLAPSDMPRPANRRTGSTRPIPSSTASSSLFLARRAARHRFARAGGGCDGTRRPHRARRPLLRSGADAQPVHAARHFLDRPKAHRARHPRTGRRGGAVAGGVKRILALSARHSKTIAGAAPRAFACSSPSRSRTFAAMAR